MKNLIFYCAVLSLIFQIGCLENTEEKKISGAFEALQLMSSSRAYPNDNIPINGYTNAVKIHEDLTDLSVSKSLVDPWEATGPHNTGGRTLALAINPQADSTIYLGSASGGLWRSRSLGLGVSWEYVYTAPDVLGVSSIAFAQGDSTQMYIGTGEVYNNETTGDDAAYRATRGSYGVGVLKSSDGGKTWNKVLGNEYSERLGVQSVQVAPSDDNIVYAALTRGVFRSTDAGDTWDLVLKNPMATDIEIHKTNSNVVVACFGNLGSPDKGLFRTTDGGNNWVELNPPGFPATFNGKIELTSATNNPDVFYASVGNGFSGGQDGATWLFRSGDAGATWELRSQEDYSIWQGWFAHDVAVHPLDEDRILAVGIDVWNSSNGGIDLIHTSEGGVALGQPPIDGADGSTLFSHSDHHVALFHPNIPDLAFVGNDGGLYHVKNNGTNFRSANGGLQTTQFYNGFSVSHQNPNFAMGGLQDNSTAVFSGTKAWTKVVGGDGSYTGISYDDDQNIYASYQNLNILRSTNGGTNFFNMNVKQGGDTPVFIAPYEIAESDPNIMYAGSQYFYRSSNRGDFWSRGNSGIPLNGDPIFNIGVSPVNPFSIMASTAPYQQKSALFVSTDGGLIFQEINMSDLPDRFINDIVFDPIDMNTVYITFNGFGTGHLFVTNDLGESWEDLSSSLPDAPGNAIAIDPTLTDHLYFGNDIGIYVSTDAGQTWDVFEDGIEGAFIAMDLEISPVDNKIWMATHGRGAYRRDLLPLPSAVDDSNELTSKINVKVYPNPISGTAINLEVSSPETLNLKFQLLDMKGQKVQDFSSLQIDSGTNSYTFAVDKQYVGSYILNCTYKEGSISKVIIFE